MNAPSALSLRPFRGPRYWGTWLAYGALRAVARLSFPRQLALGKSLGRLLSLLSPRRRRIVAVNLAACFPELSAAERTELARRHFEAVGLSFVEMAIGWFSPPERLRGLIQVEGREHFERARASGRGVILLSAHFTSLETGFAVFLDLCPGIGCMYQPQRNPMMDVLIRRGRSRYVTEQIPRDNVRALLRKLKAGGVVAYFPDQTYVGNQSALLPFFGEPAMTNIATAKFARLTGAIILPYLFRRLPGTAGYAVTIMPPLEPPPDEEPIDTTRRWVEMLEQYIRLAPEQYLWMYKRFKRRPAPLPELYD